jgi:CheY-like chemotaxis protein
MDCEMPVMDGFSATRRIREIEARGGGTAHVPIVALTAHALAEVRDRCFAAGMDDFLVKPFDEKTLVQTLRHWLAPRAATAAARSASALPDGAG